MSVVATEDTHKSKREVVVITGASGQLGQVLVQAFARSDRWELRLTDMCPPKQESLQELPLDIQQLYKNNLRLIDLGSDAARPQLAEMLEGCSTVLHFGAGSNEMAGFDAILAGNIVGMRNLFDACVQAAAKARAPPARIVFASSNHAIGMHPRSERELDINCELAPDGFYGLSKAYGEMMGDLYCFKHAVQTISFRIGSCLPRPNNARALSTWLSYPDLVDFCFKAATADLTGITRCLKIWGCSNNSRTFWGRDDRDLIQWHPHDSADPWASELAGVVSNDPQEEKYQGGFFVPIPAATPI